MELVADAWNYLQVSGPTQDETGKLVRMKLANDRCMNINIPG